MAGYSDVVQALVNAGANLHATGRNGGTPLHVATLQGHSQVAQLLINAGADLHGHHEKLSHLSPGKACWLMQTLVTTGFVTMGGHPVSEAWPIFRGALHYAVSEEHADVAQALIKAGANLHTKIKNDWTPLHIAAGVGHVDVVNVLIKAGADLHASGKTGGTPLAVAQAMEHRSVVDMIQAAME